MKRAQYLQCLVDVFILSFIAALLSACSGTMMGMVRQGGESVNFQFEDGGLGSGTIRTALSDGEIFEGKFVEVSSSGFGAGLGTAWSGNNTAYGTTFGTIETYSGNVEAVLFGNKGHTMKCRFRTADPAMGLPSGGVGICQTSDGRVIDIQF